MTNPNLQSSEFEDSLDLDSFASLENQLRSLPLRSPSTEFDSRMESLFQNETCAFHDTNSHSVATADRANGHRAGKLNRRCLRRGSMVDPALC